MGNLATKVVVIFTLLRSKRYGAQHVYRLFLMQY